MTSTTKIFSACPLGIEARLITVETYLRRKGMASFALVGLPDASIREAKERVMAAIRTSGFKFPYAKITISLAPAHVKKEGAELDLPIALGIMAQAGHIPQERSQAVFGRYLFLGELSLDGSLRGVRGTLAAACAARENGFQGLVVPEANKEEAALVDGVEVIPCRNLMEAMDWVCGHADKSPYRNPEPAPGTEGVAGEFGEGSVDLAEILGNALAKKALEVAAAGGHHLLLIGPPGAGKTLMARALAALLPPLVKEEALEITKIYSLAGLLKNGHSSVSQRPFRMAHHTASDVALVGGGSRALPGEITLAHGGVLFLDEMAEFSPNALEALRQPMEDGEISVSRAAARFRYPSRFMLVAATNPCPCGWWGSKERECLCRPYHALRYRSRISGPILDRIDIQVEVNSLEFRQALLRPQSVSGQDIRPPEESSSKVRERVVAVREIQRRRFDSRPFRLNAHMSLAGIKAYCKLDQSTQHFLGEAMKRYALSARAYHRILKVARTIADLSQDAAIQKGHVSLALQMRALDKIREGVG